MLMLFSFQSLDTEGMDALMEALRVWHGGIILISHDERFINHVCNQLWVCADGRLEKWYGILHLSLGSQDNNLQFVLRMGDVSSYKVGYRSVYSRFPADDPTICSCPTATHCRQQER